MKLKIGDKIKWKDCLEIYIIIDINLDNDQFHQIHYEWETDSGDKRTIWMNSYDDMIRGLTEGYIINMGDILSPIKQIKKLELFTT